MTAESSAQSEFSADSFIRQDGLHDIGRDCKRMFETFVLQVIEEMCCFTWAMHCRKQSR